MLSILLVALLALCSPSLSSSDHVHQTKVPVSVKTLIHYLAQGNISTQIFEDSPASSLTNIEDITDSVSLLYGKNLPNCVSMRTVAVRELRLNFVMLNLT